MAGTLEKAYHYELHRKTNPTCTSPSDEQPTIDNLTLYHLLRVEKQYDVRPISVFTDDSLAVRQERYGYQFENIRDICARLGKEIRTSRARPINQEVMKVGIICLCIQKMSNMIICWKRGIISELNFDQKTALVYFMDFGNSENVIFPSIFPMDKSLFHYPMQACVVRVLKTGGTSFTEEELEDLMDMTDGEIICKLKVLKILIGYQESEEFVPGQVAYEAMLNYKPRTNTNFKLEGKAQENTDEQFSQRQICEMAAEKRYKIPTPIALTSLSNTDKEEESGDVGNLLKIDCTSDAQNFQAVKVSTSPKTGTACTSAETDGPVTSPKVDTSSITSPNAGTAKTMEVADRFLISPKINKDAQIRGRPNSPKIDWDTCWEDRTPATSNHNSYQSRQGREYDRYQMEYNHWMRTGLTSTRTVHSSAQHPNGRNWSEKRWTTDKHHSTSRNVYHNWQGRGQGGGRLRSNRVNSNPQGPNGRKSPEIDWDTCWTTEKPPTSSYRNSYQSGRGREGTHWKNPNCPGSSNTSKAITKSQNLNGESSQGGDDDHRINSRRGGH